MNTNKTFDVNAWVRPNIREMKPYSSARDEFHGTASVFLDANENPYNAPYNRYPDPMQWRLKEKVSAIKGVPKECILLGNGSDEPIDLIMRAFCEPGKDAILTLDPTYGMYQVAAEINHVACRKVKLTPDFQIDMPAFLSQIDDTVKAIYLCSPNNPTGGVVDLKTIEYLLNKYKDKLLALDFTYFNFSELSHQEFFDLVKRYDNVAILKSFSKDFALAGLRLGFIYANKNIINEVKKVISPYSVNAAAVIAGIEALSDIHYFREIMHEIKKSKAYLIEELNKLGFRAYSTQANFVLCDFGDYADFYYQKLLNNGIKVKYFKNIKGLDNTFRITVPPTEGAKKFIDVLKVKPMFVFDLDGVVFDVKNSYREAIKKTFASFTGYECSDEDMQDAKNMGGLANDWDLTHYLIKKAGFSADYNDLIRVFQNYFFVPDKEGSKGLIDREEVVFNSSFFEKLT